MPSERDMLEWLIAGQGRIETKLNTILESELFMTQEVDDLNAAVAELGTAVGTLTTQATASEAEIAQLLQQLTSASANGDAAGVEAAVAAIKTQTAAVTAAAQGLAAAVPAPVAPAPTALVLSTTLPDATVGVAYTGAVTATGGIAPYTFSSSPGAGLSMDTSGNITGEPSTTGSIDFAVSVTDSAVPPATVSERLSLNINPAAS